MVALLVGLVIAVIVAWFLFWAADILLPHIPLPPNIASFISALVKVLIIAIIVFIYVIPLIRMLPGAFPAVHF